MSAAATTPSAAVKGRALVQAHDLAKTFDVSAPWLNRVIERKPRTLLHAVDGVSFEIEKGKTLALVGEWARTRADQEQVLAAFTVKCDVLWSLLDAVEHASSVRADAR